MRPLLFGSLAALIASAACGAQESRPAPEASARSYCINAEADFYEYAGGTCRSGYQLGPGNCRLSDGSFRAVSREACRELGGMIALPSPPALDPGRLLPPRPPGQ
jgi:hypothetical protein